jgi:hypothetical protein
MGREVGIMASMPSVREVALEMCDVLGDLSGIEQCMQSMNSMTMFPTLLSLLCAHPVGSNLEVKTNQAVMSCRVQHEDEVEGLY